MIKLVRLVWYWAFHLPWKFTVPLVFSGLLSLSGLAYLVQLFEMTEVTDLIAKLAGIDMLGPVVDGTGVLEYPHIAFRVFFEGFVAFALFLIILLASYNVAAFIYRKARTHPVGSIYVHTPRSA